MKKTLIAVAAALALNASSAWAEQVLRLSHNAAPGNPKAEASLKFAELVEEKTDGRVRVEVGGSAQYGDDVESLTNMRLGTLAFSANSQGTTSNIVPQFGVIGLPFLFNSLEHAYKVVDGPVGDKLNELAEQKGLVLLALWDNGMRHVSNNVRPIKTPEDLAGIKLRTPPDPMTLDIFTALGANPGPLAFSELYIALQQGVFDGEENPLMNIYSSKLHEVQKYISLTGHKYETTPLLASKIIWSQLSKEDQQAVKEAAVEAGKLNREMSIKADAELIQKLQDAGVEINTVDIAPFAAKTKSVYDEWHEKYPELVDLVTSEAAKQ
ncbi:TRAP transporter substrate-binding protein [Marinobacterium lutimaris]|uniref:Tripartite ATP-independent transporter solute receptor, DctP family n=1 Tax=Marinobacterium lutimaris TaxID=568106 RepID=A0A1H6DUK8_9GAMM|nr:TRAP transporter substrate-binding protein [Marinobacterium lutimaris]SEG89037.1 tripartite ATP-independent transporter solute receptor, DctP family [Marinobacterium lutimaris]